MFQNEAEIRKTLKSSLSYAMPQIVKRFNEYRITGPYISRGQVLQVLRLAWDIAKQYDGGGLYTIETDTAYGHNYNNGNPCFFVGADTYGDTPTIQGDALIELTREILTEAISAAPLEPIILQPIPMDVEFPKQGRKVNFSSLDIIGCVFKGAEVFPLDSNLDIIYQEGNQHYKVSLNGLSRKTHWDYRESYGVQCFEPQAIINAAAREKQINPLKKLFKLSGKHFAFASATYCSGLFGLEPTALKLTEVVTSPEKVDTLLTYIESVGIPLLHYKAWLKTGYRFTPELKQYIDFWDGEVTTPEPESMSLADLLFQLE